MTPAYTTCFWHTHDVLNKHQLIKQFKQDISAEEVWLHAAMQRETRIQRAVAAAPVAKSRVALWLAASLAVAFLATFVITIITDDSWLHTLLVALIIWFTGQVIVAPVVLRWFGTRETWLTRHRYQQLRQSSIVPEIDVRSYIEGSQVVTDVAYNGYAHRVESLSSHQPLQTLARCEQRNQKAHPAIVDWLMAERDVVATAHPEIIFVAEPIESRKLLDIEHLWYQ